MKTEFQNSVVRLSFLCHITDIKNAWKNVDVLVWILEQKSHIA